MMPDDNDDEITAKEVSVPAKPAKQQWKIKALPDVIAGHTEEDKDLIIIWEEINQHQRNSTYGTPFRVTTSVKGKPPDNSVVLLNKLTTDQVHVFGRNMGVPGCFSKSKFLCHVAIAHHFNFRNRLGKYGLSPTAQANQTTFNLCRAINVVFSDSFMNGLKTVNDKKSQHDHETSNTHKHFWIHAYSNRQDDDVICYVNEVIHDTFDTAAAVATEFDPEETDDECANVDVALGVTKHSTTDDIVLDEFSLIVVPTNDPYLADLEDNAEIDLENLK